MLSPAPALVPSEEGRPRPLLPTRFSFLAPPTNQDGRHSQAKSGLLAGNKAHFLAFFFFFNLMTSLEGFPLLMADSQDQFSVCAKGRTFLVASEFLEALGLPAAGELPHGCGQGPTGASGAGVGEQFPIL